MQENRFFFNTNSIFFRLHDGGFTDVTDDNEPAPPTWTSWMINIPEYKITTDMRYSGLYLIEK